jgi:c-di-GMP-binding flagellar brake protein YcgR
VLIDRPQEVKAVQRRNDYRVRFSQDSGLRTRMWRIPEHWHLTDKPARGAELSVVLNDISIGGLGVTLMPKEGEPPKILPDERVRVTLKQDEQDELILEGRIRAPRPDKNSQSIRSGVQFMKLQDGLEGRRILTELTKLVGAMQLDEVRRRRLGLA